MSKVYPELVIRKYAPITPEEDWLDLKFAETDLVQIERLCFHENIQADWEGMKELMRESVSCYLVDDIRYGKDRFVGSAYAIPLEKKEDIEKEDPHYEHWMSVIDRYECKRVAYLYNISIHPECQGKDLAKRLMIEILADCKRQGYDVLLSHAKVGGSLHLHEFFGSMAVGRQKNWYETGEEYILCSINLHNTVLVPLVPFQQDFGYDCGIACMETLLHHTDTPVDREVLIENSGVDNQGTTHGGIVKALLSSSRFDVRFIDNESDLMDSLASFNPVILHVLSPGTYEGHYVVAMGRNDDSVYVFEPYDGLFGRMSIAELRRSWWSNKYRNSWGITIVKE
jgi:ribosomal protein S18 acetylase RimI-like enzyme